MRAMLDYRHGCLLASLLMTLADASAQQSVRHVDVPALRTDTIEVHYRVAPSLHGLVRVELWYTGDGGKTWLEYGDDPDCTPPALFSASGEGIYGFYVVAVNAAGASSHPPEPGTTPHAHCLVDWTAPVVQLHTVAGFPDFAQSRTVHLAWSAYDSHPAARGVSIYYQQAGQQTWQPIETALPDTKAYDWRAPDGVSGSVRLKLSVVDRAGNRTDRTSAAFFLEPRARPVRPEAGGAPHARIPKTPGTPVSEQVPAPSAIQRAGRLYELGVWHLNRGELDVASERLREALQLDQGLIEARNDLAGILYEKRQYELALAEYRRSLALNPAEPHALMGLALSHMARNEFAPASAALQEILLAQPESAETWLHLGDVAEKMGNRARARMCWQKAAELSSSDSETASHARERLKALPARR